jgi:hypothetical protein
MRCRETHGDLAGYPVEPAQRQRCLVAFGPLDDDVSLAVGFGGNHPQHVFLVESCFGEEVGYVVQTAVNGGSRPVDLRPAKDG